MWTSTGRVSLERYQGRWLTANRFLFPLWSRSKILYQSWIINFHFETVVFEKNYDSPHDVLIHCKVGCVFPMVIIPILPQAEFVSNVHREDAPHFTKIKFVGFLPDMINFRAGISNVPSVPIAVLVVHCIAQFLMKFVPLYE